MRPVCLIRKVAWSRGDEMWLRCGLILAVCDLVQSIELGEQAILHNVKVASRDALIRAVQNSQPGTQILIAG